MDMRIAILPLLLLAACAGSDPMRYVPPTQRAALAAEARLGQEGGATAGGRVTVAQMLSRARGTPGGTGESSRGHVIRFDATQVQPDDRQRETLSGFAERARGRGAVSVRARPSLAEEGDTTMIGQRRALAVARVLADAGVPDVDVRFEREVPRGEVLVAMEGNPR